MSTLTKRLPLLVGLLGFLGLATAAMLVWLLWVPDTRGEEAARLEAQARQRFEADQATPPEENSAVLLRPVLVTKTESADMGPVGSVTRRDLRLLDDYVGPEAGEIRANLRKDPARAARDVEAYAPVAALMRAALQRPRFVWPVKWEDGADRPHPDYMAMRTLAQGLTISALQASLLDRPGEALELYLDAMAWGGQSAGQTLIQEMLSLAMASMPMEPLLELLASGRLTPGQLASAERRLASLPFSPEAFRNAVDGEFGFARAVLARVPRIRPGSDVEVGPLADLLAWGPFMGRERRLYDRGFLAVRDGAIAFEGPPPTGPERERSPWRDGLCATLMVPDLGRAQAVYRAFLTDLGGARLLAALQRHRALCGRWPARLEDLGMELPRNYLGAQPGFHYEVKGEQMRLSADGPVLRARRLRGPRSYHPYALPAELEGGAAD